LQISCCTCDLSPLTMADWDADDFEPDTATPTAGVTTIPSDKWDGEDEEDDIKDAWDAESDEDNSEKSEEVKPVKVKKKKTLAQKIAEKEEAAEQAMLEKMKMDQEELEANTPEGKLAEKMRLQKLTEENDLKIAQDMFGADAVGAVGGIDAMNPETKEEFDDFSKAVLDKITSLESSELFQDFAEEFVRSLCMSLNVQTLKKCKTHVEAFHSAKLKEEKAATGKGKKGKNPLKSLKMDRDSTTNYYDGYNDMDDFM